MARLIHDMNKTPATEARRVTKPKIQTDAVRRAPKTPTMRERLARSTAQADAMGPSDAAFEQKRFMDEMWDDI